MPADARCLHWTAARPCAMNNRMANDDEISKGQSVFRPNPFEALCSTGLPAGPENPAPLVARVKSRGRVDILRQTAHRGGKTVTVVTNFTGIGLAEKENLAKQMQKACGAGGTVKEGRIEIQGDKREQVARILTEAGFQPMYSGG